MLIVAFFDLSMTTVVCSFSHIVLDNHLKCKWFIHVRGSQSDRLVRNYSIQFARYFLSKRFIPSDPKQSDLTLVSRVLRFDCAFLYQWLGLITPTESAAFDLHIVEHILVKQWDVMLHLVDTLSYQAYLIIFWSIRLCCSTHSLYSNLVLPIPNRAISPPNTHLHY